MNLQPMNGQDWAKSKVGQSFTCPGSWLAGFEPASLIKSKQNLNVLFTKMYQQHTFLTTEGVANPLS
jgi:hypothetical protein